MKRVLKDLATIGLVLAAACILFPMVFVYLIHVTTPPKPPNLFAQLVDAKTLKFEPSGNVRFNGQLLQKLHTDETGNWPPDLKNSQEGKPDPAGVVDLGSDTWLLTCATIKSKAGEDSNARVTDNYIYQRQTKKYRPVASLSEARGLHSMLKLSDGRILIFGGYDNSANCIGSIELLDLKKNTCSIIAHSSEPRVSATLVEIAPNTVLAIGGHYPESTMVERINVDDHSCVTLGHLNKSRCFTTAVYRVSSTEYLVTGGSNGLSEPDSSDLPPELIKVPAEKH